ncbi:conserved exported protein of unknown function [Sterolibacterium denitrificans]|uniref:PepSY domain-containing protein n=1 Tax=Sterolibacterium denitrificans TaxID=157592 RepID=A0A7Z7HPT0_9PROT|nr:PepSY domain-containing protein [Sterolibacterium denitrificans]SMB22628.1 conserved exported protein of unknown function [Sterolibacterium denitrificans]
MKTKSLTLGLILASAIAVPASLSLAASATANTPATSNASTASAPWLTIGQVYNRLEAAGYRNIDEIERERSAYEVKATNQNGQRVKLYVHPQTGVVLDVRPRDGKDKRDGWNRRGTAGGQSGAGLECNERRCRDDLPSAAGSRP